MTIFFYKTGEMNGSNFVKFPLRSNAILIIENNGKYCSIWSILASLHPCNKNHPKRLSNYKQYFNELKRERFDFTNGFNCSDDHRFNEINNLSINIFESNFYQDQYKWKYRLIPIEVSKNDSDRVIHLLDYKNRYALIKQFNIFSGDQNKKFVCRR